MTVRRIRAQELLPLMDPLYNIRECCKQMCLLEDHLIHLRKRCLDCITKHFLTLEGLFEEASSLDTDGKWAVQLEGKAELMRSLFKSVLRLDGEACQAAANALRQVRKELMPDARTLKLAASCPHQV